MPLYIRSILVVISGAVLCLAQTPVIDVYVFYSERAGSYMQGTLGADDFVQDLIDETNKVFSYSNVNLKVNAIGKMELSSKQMNYKDCKGECILETDMKSDLLAMQKNVCIKSEHFRTGADLVVFLGYYGSSVIPGLAQMNGTYETIDGEGFLSDATRSIVNLSFFPKWVGSRLSLLFS